MGIRIASATATAIALAGAALAGSAPATTTTATCPDANLHPSSDPATLDRSPAGLVAGWMRSAAHRVNILKGGYREIGIGAVPGSPSDAEYESAVIVTTDFGARR